jgi:RNA polymerase sigma-70 factor (ECF subfamily)
MAILNDPEIIESVRRGNVSDFSLLIDRYKHKAFSMISRMLKNKMDAEEVLQDCFVKAFNNLSSFKGDSLFSTWFYRIVYNTTLSRLGMKKRQIEEMMLSIGEELDFEDTDADTSGGKKETKELLNSLIEKLPPNYAAVINLFYIEEMSCEEISVILNTGVPNVKVLLHRSRTALKKLIKENNLEDELR